MQVIFWKYNYLPIFSLMEHFRTATGSRRERRKMTCDNGDQIKKMKVIRALLQNKCVCPDNSLPKCNDGEPPKCPITDEAPDPNLSGSVIDILSRCNP